MRILFRLTQQRLIQFGIFYRIINSTANDDADSGIGKQSPKIILNEKLFHRFVNKLVMYSIRTVRLCIVKSYV
ncbi:hypothetical protein SDC9_207293 [bioreactor metagenome]|uniref:Uncharacterized protein n=1 Tax=bioreactor metagenome TaxID=1076179 RepID=A0A645J8X4_9ZZZZ